MCPAKRRIQESMPIRDISDGWMNDELTQRYLSKVIGNFTITFGGRLVEALCEIGVGRTIDLSIPSDVQLLSQLCYENFNKKGEPCKSRLRLVESYNLSYRTIQDR